MRRIIVYSASFLSAGGVSVASAFARSAERPETQVAYLVPAELAETHNLQPCLTPAGVNARLRLEYEAMKQARPSDLFLCVANLPPALRLPCRVAVLFQNKGILDSANFPGTRRLKNLVSRFWLKAFGGNADIYVVQSEEIKRCLDAMVRTNAVVRRIVDLSLPAVAPNQPRTPTAPQPFVYLASGDPHKNHKNLLKAWKVLHKWGYHLELQLTVDSRFAELSRLIGQCNEATNGAVVNLGALPRAAAMQVLSAARALIYPSLVESLGVPLFEAQSLGIPVIAAERDYVRDVLDPVQTFDPESPVSIARAVVRFLGRASPVAQLCHPAELVQELLEMPLSHLRPS